MPSSARPAPRRRFPLPTLALAALLGLLACSGKKEEKPRPPDALDDAALPMSPAPGDLLPATLPGFTIELSAADSKQDSVRDNVVAFVRKAGSTEDAPALKVAIGRVDGPSIQGRWAEMYQGFQKPAFKLTDRIHGFTLHQRAVRAGELKQPEEHEGSKALLWFRYYRDVPVMVFASDEETGKRFIDELCAHWEGPQAAPQAKAP